jgi:hypothetical protein
VLDLSARDGRVVAGAEVGALVDGGDRLAATEAVEGRPETAVQIAAAAEVYAHQEGIVNVYSEETPGREFVDQARASLSADVAASATEVGSKLTIGEALDLARLPQTTAT